MEKLRTILVFYEISANEHKHNKHEINRETEIKTIKSWNYYYSFLVPQICSAKSVSTEKYLKKIFWKIQEKHFQAINVKVCNKFIKQKIAYF